MKKRILWISISVVLVIIAAIAIPLSIYFSGSGDDPVNHPSQLSAGVTDEDGVFTSWEDLITQEAIQIDEKKPMVLGRCDQNLSGELVVPDGITTIGMDAFITCQKLTRIVLPDSVEVLGLDSFYNCINLEEVVISNTSSLKEIGYGAFTYCHKLKTLNIPATVTKIEESAFIGCTALDNITLPSSIDVIPSHLFKDCESLKEFHHGSLKIIEPYAFYNCRSLASFDFTGIERIGDTAFFGCDSITHISLPNTLKVLEHQAFLQCLYLDTVEFEEGTQFDRLGVAVFEECVKLKTINLPMNLNYIPDYFFSGCEELETFTIEQHIVSIGKFAFFNCIKLHITFASKGAWVYSMDPNFATYERIYFYDRVDGTMPIEENIAKLIDGLEGNYFKIIDEIENI